VGSKPLDHVSELLSAYLDGQVTLAERQAVEAHLPSCPECQAELEYLRALRSALRSLPEAPVPRSFVLGPRAVRPAALSGTFGGFLRAATSVAASLAVVALSVNLAIRGLPRQTTVAAPAVAPAAASAPALAPAAASAPLAAASAA